MDDCGRLFVPAVFGFAGSLSAEGAKISHILPAQMMSINAKTAYCFSFCFCFAHS
jgi:hypothetical protein